MVTITSQLLSDSRRVFLHGQDEPRTFIVCTLFRPRHGCDKAALFNCSRRDADASSAAVLDSSYYWGRSPLFIPLKGSAGVGGWLLGKRTTPSRCDRNKTPTLSGNSSFAQTRPCACPKRNHFQRKVPLASTVTKIALANSDAESVQGFLFQPESAIPTDYVLLFPAVTVGDDSCVIRLGTKFSKTTLREALGGWKPLKVSNKP